MLKRFGTEYGGFYYPSNLKGLDKDSIIYCVGAGEDISHDVEIAKQLQSTLYIIDPTPRAVEHVDYVKRVYRDEDTPVMNKKFGGGDPGYWDIIQKNKIDSEKIKLIPYALHTTNDYLKFYSPINKDYVSHSLVEGIKSSEYIVIPTKTLETIMREFHHKTIDLLKIDIEGSECAVLNDMLDKKIFPKYISVDFDSARLNNIEKLNECKEIIKRILNNNYVVLHNRNYDISFQLL
jgi:FkbM family methyltransferase